MTSLDRWLKPYASTAATIANVATKGFSGSRSSENSSSNLALYQELYQERAGIIQFDAELPAGEAELRALKDVSLQYMQDHLPDVLATITEAPTGPP